MVRMLHDSRILAGTALVAARIVWTAGMVCCLSLAAPPARADYCTITPPECATGLRPGDDLWLVSTRCLDSVCCGGLFQPDVRHCDPAAGWNTARLDDLLAAKPMPTIIYVHGNRATYDESIVSGWDLYYSLARWSDLPAVRLIIWTWPSDQIPGALRDARVKADRADGEAFFLAEFLDRVAPETSLSLIGYSFGCRVIGGALHLVAGGSLLGMTGNLSDQWRHRTAETRVAMMAAAMDHSALTQDGLFGQAIGSVDQLLVLYNSCDPVLKRYHFLEQCRGSRAMGYAGPSGPFAVDGVWEKDVGPFVGRSHSLAHYLGSPDVIAAVGRYALFTGP